MKRLILVLLLLFSIKIGYTQNPDFLKKYSYFCFTHDGANAHTGTCFFYKDKSRIYVVSNYHVFYGVNTILGQQDYHVDTLYIIYRPKDSITNSFYKLFVGADTVVNFIHYDSPDIIAYTVHPDKNFKINVINDLIDSNYLDSIPNAVYAYGYPTDAQNGLNVKDSVPRVNLTTGDYLVDFTDFPNAYVPNGVPFYYTPLFNTFSPMPDYVRDYLHGIHVNLLKTEFEISKYSAKGYSGSPVFGEFYKGKKKIYKFIGVIFASNTTTDKTVCIKASYVYHYLTN